jgi:hypothetical protein
MITVVMTLGICTVGIGSVFGLRAATRVPQAVVPESGAVVEGRGLLLQPVSAELTAQLGLEDGVGFFVQGVETGSAAADATLQPFDVVLTIDGEAADATRVRNALNTDRGLALRILRAGMMQDVALGQGSGESQEEFLSSAGLSPDHPFRRLAQLQSLREGYSSKAKDYSERIRELDSEKQALREAAQVARQELQTKCEEQITAFLEARRTELLERVDADLSAELAVSLPALRLDLLALLPAGRLEAVSAQLEELAQGLRSEIGEAVPLNAGEQGPESEKRARQRFARVGEEGASLLGERVERTWREGRQILEQDQDRLGAKHDERAAWAAEQVLAIHEEVTERVNCAIDRAHAELSRAVTRRLSENQLPAPGELEQALQELALQLEAFTQRFTRRTASALEAYEDSVGSAHATLASQLLDRLGAGEQAGSDLSEALAAARREHLEAAIALDGTWRDFVDTDARADALARALLQAVNAGRDHMRRATMAWRDGLREEGVVSEDAWSDLRRSLSRLKNEAESNCWKLDGPHLDGRFPRREAGTKERGDVAVVTRR